MKKKMDYFRKEKMLIIYLEILNWFDFEVDRPVWKRRDGFKDKNESFNWRRVDDSWGL